MKPVTSEEFSEILEKILPGKVSSVAVAVSGGPDSMALAKLLSLWAKKNGVQVHVLTVDHGLRPESGAEAFLVEITADRWAGVRHSILPWKGRKPKSRLMEAARAARYELMAEYCRKHKIRHLFLAHHQDDQAETFLFRLAKGSGLDGLSAMKTMQEYSPPPFPPPIGGRVLVRHSPKGNGGRVGDLILVRPFLGIPKDRLIATCKKHKIPYVKDPSNKTERFARPRLRKSWKVLEAEGLSTKRLSTTASRLERARKALDEIAEKTFKKSALKKSPGRIVINATVWARTPTEIALRALIKAIRYLRPDADYLPRMEKIEDLFADLINGKPFRKRTLGGLVFERDDRKNNIIIATEQKT